MFNSIMVQASQNTLPMRLGIVYLRKDSVTIGKYKTNHKRSL